MAGTKTVYRTFLRQENGNTESHKYMTLKEGKAAASKALNAPGVLRVELCVVEVPISQLKAEEAKAKKAAPQKAAKPRGTRKPKVEQPAPSTVQQAS